MPSKSGVSEEIIAGSGIVTGAELSLILGLWSMFRVSKSLVLSEFKYSMLFSNGGGIALGILSFHISVSPI